MMAVLAGGEVISAVAKKVRAATTTTEIKEIYKNKPKQGMETPCAFIHQIEEQFAPEMRNRGEQFYMIDVRCHPTPTNTTIDTWAQTLATKLLGALETITVSSQTVRARSISWKQEDGVLHFIVSYSFKVAKQPAVITDMEELTITERVN